jgi:FixJ family two-component response regulator
MLDHLRSAQEADSLEAADALIDVLNDLTPREREILTTILDGKPAKSAARELGISTSTYDAHRTRVFLKFRTHSATQLLLRFAKASFAFPRALAGHPELSALPDWLLRRAG